MSPTSTSSVVGVEGHDSCNSQSLQGFTNSPANRASRRGLLRQRLYEKRRFARAEGPCKHVSLSTDVEFIGRVGDRVTGKKLEDLVFVELFSGSGGLCAEVRRLGLSNSIGVDAHISKHTKCPVLRIDMTTDYGMELVWRILGQENCIAVHMGPPCGTSSRARDIRRRKGPDPKPLRSDRWPDGLPSLQGSDKRRVGLANELYLQCAKTFEYCTRVGILCTIENPGNSYFWSTTFMTGLAVGYNDIFLHHCMFGSERKKLTRLRANFEQLAVIGVRCDDQHIHAKWGLVKSKWATSLEVEYPHALCKAWARVFVDTILALGAVSPPLQLSELPEHSLRQSQAATYRQPRGKRLPVREYKQVCVLTGPVSDMWQPVISSDWKIPATLQCTVNLQCRLSLLAPNSFALRFMGETARELLMKNKMTHNVLWNVQLVFLGSLGSSLSKPKAMGTQNCLSMEFQNLWKELYNGLLERLLVTLPSTGLQLR